jgi:hypothetical protein
MGFFVLYSLLSFLDTLTGPAAICHSNRLTVSPAFRARTKATAPLRDVLLPPATPVEIAVLYSTEKEEWLNDVVAEFENAPSSTATDQNQFEEDRLARHRFLNRRGTWFAPCPSFRSICFSNDALVAQQPT